jgi:cobalt-zinc-cadmium resistance protein CzcA
MVDKILEFSLRQRARVLLATVALVGGGIWSAVKLPIDAVPDITGVQVQINTEIPALAAEESEKLVTRRIELEMAGLPGLEEMRSLTKFGLSQVTLNFKDGTDVFRARRQWLSVCKASSKNFRLASGQSWRRSAPARRNFLLQCPIQAGRQKQTSNGPDQLIELSEIQEYTIKPLLRTVPGIAEINESGGYEKQFVIHPDPEKLARVNMTFSELADLVAQNVQNAGGGIISRNGQQLTIRAVSRVARTEEIENLPLKFGAAVRPLLVKDVAAVELGTKFRTGAATLNGHETVIGTTMMLLGQNSREVAERVKARIAEIQTKLPDGVKIQIQYDRSQLINRTIHTVRNNLFEGAILVIAVLFALLGNWRAALIVTLAIPLSFLFALMGMERLGISGNLMSLGAIDFGLIIDGAVVTVENIVRQLAERQHHLGRKLTAVERGHVVLTASKQVGNPMFFGVLIITMVYIPILALTGIEGKMFHPMALTVMLALTGALLLTLTLMPVLCSFLLRGRIGETDNFIIRALKAIYRPMLQLALKLRWLVVLAAIAAFAGAIWLFNHLGAEFIPKLDEGSITSMLYKPVGMSLEESLRSDIEVENTLLRDFPEITRVFTRIGTSDIATDPIPPNESDVYIFYKPITEWPKTPGRPRSKSRVNAQIGEALKS